MAAVGRESVEIRPLRGWIPVNAGELWRSRELIWLLALRDIRVRYKQSVLGVAWVVAPPLLTMLAFSVIFGALMGAAGRPTMPGVPYAISTFCALVPWQLFANSLRGSGNSLLANRNLILKVYFPRLAVPIVPVVVALIDFCAAFIVLLLLIAGHQLLGGFTFAPGPEVLLLPVLTLLAIVTSLSVSVWIAALGAVYRDFNLAGPFTVQLLMYATPVVYTFDSVSHVLGRWGAMLYGLNPMVGVVEGFRWALLGGAPPPPELFASACAVSVVTLVCGLHVFRRMEQVFVDLI